MNGFGLPCEVPVGGVWQPVYTDYRDILDVMEVLEAERDVQAAVFVALNLFYKDFDSIAAEHYGEAFGALCDFLRCGQPEQVGRTPGKLIDWQQDAALIAAEVNRVAGCEVRGLRYLHWYTFMGYFGCVGEGQLATVVAIRHKKARGKRLEDWEQEFYRNNRGLVDLQKQYGETDRQQKEELWKRLGGGGTGR